MRIVDALLDGLVQEVELPLLIVLVPLRIEIEPIGVRCQREFGRRRDASTLRPLAVAILSRNPCLFFLLRFEG